MKTTPALLAALALTAAAAAQAPEVSLSFVAAPAGSGLPTALPAGQSISSAEWLAPGRLLINTDTHRTFLADGASVLEVCLPGTQIPGQAPGVVWGNAMRYLHAFPLRDRPPLFTLSASGPGIGSNVLRTFIGDPAGPDAFWMSAGDSVISRCTPTGLTSKFLNQGELQIGPVDGALLTVVPPNFSPPGLPASITGWQPPSCALNSDGAFVGLAVLSSGDFMVAAVESGAFRTVSARGQAIVSDRGPFTANGTVSPATQLLGDGSAVLSALLPFDGRSRGLAFVLHPAGDAVMIAVSGDPAPGAAGGVTISGCRPLAATRDGKVLWWSDLQNNGAPAGRAIYLWSHSRSRQILRSGTAVPGAPDGAVVPTFDPSAITAMNQINDDGDVALLTGPGAQAVYLYTPEAGTVEVARDAPNSVVIVQNASVVFQGLSPAYGVLSGFSFTSGGDDDRADLLSPDGTFAFCSGGSVNRAFGAFALAARITSPGCRPDYNADGFLDFFDYIAFIDCFEGVGGCPNGKDADFNNDDFADFFDFIDFVDAFERGC